MPLYWIVHRNGADPVMAIFSASHLAAARLKAAVAGVGGDFVEAHELGDKIGRKVPKDLIGRALTLKEAQELLNRLR